MVGDGRVVAAVDVEDLAPGAAREALPRAVKYVGARPDSQHRRLGAHARKPGAGNEAPNYRKTRATHAQTPPKFGRV